MGEAMRRATGLAGAAALMVALAGCVQDSCACQYPEGPATPSPSGSSHQGDHHS